MSTDFIEGGFELVDMIKPLWLKLNAHHKNISPYFADDFQSFKFEDRKSDLSEKAMHGQLRIVLSSESNIPHGYCIASVDGKEGEIDSIFVDQEFRKHGTGSQLMSRCMDWLKTQKVTRIKVSVVFGNENAHAFYRKFGLLPRITYLTTSKWHSGNE